MTNSLGVTVLHHSSNSLNFSWSCIWTAKHQYSLADWMCADRGSPLHSNRIRSGRLNGLITLWSCTLNMLTFPLICLVTTESRPQAFLWEAELHSIQFLPLTDFPCLELASISRAVTWKMARPSKSPFAGRNGSRGDLPLGGFIDRVGEYGKEQNI